MYLGHPDIVFPLIVGERHNRIAHKPEHILLIELKPFQKVTRFTAFHPIPLPGFSDLIWRLIPIIPGNVA